MKKYPGKFIVIDGTDGSGKGTQSKLIVDRLTLAGFSVEIADFPQYGTKSAGLVEHYLNSKYGSAEEVGPYRASIFYAADRYDASFTIKKWLREGKIVIANRYVSSNMAHQGGKIKDDEERKKFLAWLHNLEYEIFDIPKPDLTIILHVDAAIAQKMVDNKEPRSYLSGKKRDIHENDINHLRSAEKIYIEIAENYNFELIECVRDGQIMSRHAINDLIWLRLKSYLNLGPEFPEPEEENVAQKFSVERLAPNAKIPNKAHPDDAGYDFYSIDYYSLMPQEIHIIQTGIRMALPQGSVGLLWDKGGVAKNGVHVLGGVYDAGYRGEVTITLINLGHDIYNIAPGDKVAQLLVQKINNTVIKEKNISEDTDRGVGRWGSTGK